MNIEELREYCLSKPGSTEEFPFDESTLVFKVGNKMFALTDLDKELTINLKCNPEYSIELREKYNSVKAGFHMNKKHWNTIYINNDISDTEIYKLIDHSYELVFNKLTLNIRKTINKTNL